MILRRSLRVGIKTESIAGGRKAGSAEQEDQTSDVRGQTRFLTNRAGLPATTVHRSTFRMATARAPTTAPSPIVTPGPTNASAQIHASGPIVIGGRNKGKSDLV